MAEAKLNPEGLTPPELLATAAGMASALEGNPDFPAPTVTPQELTRLASELARAERVYRDERRRANDAKAKRDSVADELRTVLLCAVDYVQEASGGDLARILSANLHVEEETRLWPFGSAGDVEELSASAGDEPGEIDLVWDPVSGASGYELEIACDLAGDGPWEQGGATTRSRLTVSSLTPRCRYWFRVRAVNERGAGDWSPAVMRFTP